MGIRLVSVRRLTIAVLICAGICALALFLAPLTGSATVDYGRAWQGLSPDREILFAVRIPRTLLAALTGGSLSVAGVLLQALLRDALAEPYTIGVSAGASFGAVGAICLGLPALGPIPSVWLAAFGGAAATLFCVMAIASEGRRLSSLTLLLAGVTINSICFALILFLQSMASFAQSFAITRWLMGGIDTVSYATLAVLATLLLSLCLAACWHARAWNLVSVGEEWAAARGVHTRRLLSIGYLIASAIVGTVTAVTGPIGFVGLLIPHALRLRAGADHRLLLPCAFFVGAAFLTACDAAARTLLAPTEIPVGVVTALCGGPFFLWLLRAKRRTLWL